MSLTSGDYSYSTHVYSWRLSTYTCMSAPRRDASVRRCRRADTLGEPERMARPAEELQRMVEPVEALGALTLYEPHMIGYTPQCGAVGAACAQAEDPPTLVWMGQLHQRMSLPPALCRRERVRRARRLRARRVIALPKARLEKPSHRRWRVARLGTTRLTMPTACKQGQNDLAPHTWIAVHSQGTS